MYCPLPDVTTQLDEGGILAMTRGHRIEVSSEGLMRIINKVTAEVEFER